jgi:hypothetical protein
MSTSNASTGARQVKEEMRSMAQDVKSAAQEAVGAAGHRAQQFGSDMMHAAQERLEGL